MKYRIEAADETRVRVELTLAGRAREFVGGAVTMAPWAFGGLGIFFVPDYLGVYSQSADATRAFWWTVPLLALWICAVGGWRRATSRAWLELDAAEDRLTVQEQTWLGRPGLALEAPLSSILSVTTEPAGWNGTQVVLRFAGGGEEIVARAWHDPKALEAVAAACAAVWQEGGAPPTVDGGNEVE